jgi:hypothetical protein
MTHDDEQLRALVSRDIAELTLEGAARRYEVPSSTLARFAAGAGSRAGTVALIRARLEALAVCSLPPIMA